MNTTLQKVNKDRAFFETLGNSYPVENSISISKTPIAGISCYWFKPKAENSKQIIVYLHGGSFALGNIHSHKAMVSHIAYAINTSIVFVEYALAPEHPFPKAMNEVIEVYKELQKLYPDNKISFMGDSAGGGLAVSTVYSCIENEIPLPQTVILISPWLNLKCNTNSYKTRQKLDPVLTKENLLEYAGYYTKGDFKNADPSELIFAGFPPTFLLAGANEILFDDTKNFYEYIKMLQKETKMKEYENQTHVWMLTDIESEKSKEALTDIREFTNGYR